VAEVLAQGEEREDAALCSVVRGLPVGRRAWSNGGTGWAVTSGQSWGALGVWAESTGARLGAMASRAVNGAPSDQRSRRVRISEA